MSVNTPMNRALACGVSTATAIVFSKVAPVEVSRRTRCASPWTHGYGIAMRPRARWRNVRAGDMSNAQNASSTATSAMVTASGPSLTMESSIRPGDNSTVVTANRSTGGNADGDSSPAGCNARITPSSAARRASGTSASAHLIGPRTGRADTAAGASGLTARSLRSEETHPTELRELALMRVEHVVARIAEGRLDHDALA